MAPPSDLMPPAALISSATSWMPLRELMPNWALAPESGRITPILTVRSSACAREIKDAATPADAASFKAVRRLMPVLRLFSLVMTSSPYARRAQSRLCSPGFPGSGLQGGTCQFAGRLERGVNFDGGAHNVKMIDRLSDNLGSCTQHEPSRLPRLGYSPHRCTLHNCLGTMAGSGLIVAAAPSVLLSSSGQFPHSQSARVKQLSPLEG